MMAHQKLIADTLSGLARGILLISLSAYVIHGIILNIDFPRTELFILGACLAILLQVFAHIVLEDAMFDTLTVITIGAVIITAISVTAGIIELRKANKLKEREMQRGSVTSESPSHTPANHGF